MTVSRTPQDGRISVSVRRDRLLRHRNVGGGKHDAPAADTFESQGREPGSLIRCQIQEADRFQMPTARAVLPIFMNGALRQRRHVGHRVWLPFLLLLSGCRFAEPPEPKTLIDNMKKTSSNGTIRVVETLGTPDNGGLIHQVRPVTGRPRHRRFSGRSATQP